MFRLGPMEIVLIIAVLVLVFGAKKIPELVQGIGKGIVEFKRGLRDDPGASDTASRNGKSTAEKGRQDRRVDD